MQDRIVNLPDCLRERVRQLNEVAAAGGEFIVYWMQTALRVDENPALKVAIEIGNQLRLPVLVYHELPECCPFASDRHHTFVLEGARDVQAQMRVQFEDQIAYAFHLERAGHRGPHLATLADRAAVIVTEEMPVAPFREWTSSVARSASSPVLAVDTACIVPMRVVGRAYERAFAFRKATKAHYAQRIGLPPHRSEPEVAAGVLQLPFEPIDLEKADLAQLVSECDIDHSIGPVLDTIGGSAAGYARWGAFKVSGLTRYARQRNDALLDSVSRMSAYLHHGMVAPQRIARECAECDHPGAEKYLDELLIWRELAYAFCFYREDHDQLSALPEWAVETLAEHEADSRPALYSWETLARGETGDTLWDAAQASLVRHGELHNNVRMTWGKALVNWTPDAETALRTIIDLNHRYALDGRDPASYGGILWCLGQFDRPFPPGRPILGTVRERPTEQHARRLDPIAFRAKTTRPLVDRVPRVAVIGAGISGLMCARTLMDHGLAVTVFEKSRGCGGRMATRRVSPQAVPELHFDHGAQYFTVRDARFKRYVDSWLQDGVVAPWLGEVVVLESGEIRGSKGDTNRFVATPGMNAIAKHLAENVDLQLRTEVAPVVRDGEQWQLRSTDGAELGLFDTVIVSAPAMQTSALLQACPALSQQAANVRMSGCWALLLAFQQSLNLDFSGAFVNSSPLSWIANNSSKPTRQCEEIHPRIENWVAHASPEWSQDNIDESAEVVQAALLSEFQRVTSRHDVEPVYVAVHRWRFALPQSPLPDACLFEVDQSVGVCGDWCAGPRVEGAFLSGMAVAGRVLGALKPDHAL